MSSRVALACAVEGFVDARASIMTLDHMQVKDSSQEWQNRPSILERKSPTSLQKVPREPSVSPGTTIPACRDADICLA